MRQRTRRARSLLRHADFYGRGGAVDRRRFLFGVVPAKRASFVHVRRVRLSAKRMPFAPVFFGLHDDAFVRRLRRARLVVSKTNERRAGAPANAPSIVRPGHGAERRRDDPTGAFADPRGAAFEPLSCFVCETDDGTVRDSVSRNRRRRAADGRNDPSRGATEQNHLARVLPYGFAMALQSLVFGLLHGAPLWIAYTFVFGLVCTLVYRKHGLFASVALHMGFNFLGVFL